ncbi:MAG: rod shape-determining protein MreD [Oscillospiraceae bacterium]|nr:rod shape-determining protein MreD [Oscillospiraceae bacterium]
MKALTYTLLIIIFVALQATIGNSMKFFLAVPQVVLMLCLALSVINSKGASAAIGMAAGLVLDIATGQHIGLNALLLMHLCLLSSWLAGSYYNVGGKMVMIFCVLGNLAYSFLYYFLTIALWGGGNLGVALMQVIVPELIWSAILCLPIFVTIKKINSLFK